MSIKLLALDIGGVLITIDKTPIRNLLTRFGVSDANFFDESFLLLQRGMISPEDFLTRKFTHPHSVLEAREAFKAMFSGELSFALLDLKIPYVFLSNINQLHFDRFVEIAEPSAFALEFSTLSCRVGYLKPDHRFFFHLISKEIAKPEEILFLDDRKENLKAAACWGFKTELCKNPSMLSSILKSFNLLNASAS